jgi:hypothetical protein
MIRRTRRAEFVALLKVRTEGVLNRLKAGSDRAGHRTWIASAHCGTIALLEPRFRSDDANSTRLPRRGRSGRHQ